MFLGELDQGELEIGQVAVSIDKIESAADIIEEIWEAYNLQGRTLARQFAI